MKLRTMISSLALVSAMTLSGGAFAQSMIGGVEVPADQWGSFEQKCQLLNGAANATLAEPLDESDDATATGSVVANGEDDPERSSDASDNITALMANLTVEQCKEAGL
jgi:hypothetical protein